MAQFKTYIAIVLIHYRSCSEKIYLLAATGLHSTAQHLDACEFLDVVKMPFDEALGLVMDGTIKDSKTQVALLKYAQLRAKS